MGVKISISCFSHILAAINYGRYVNLGGGPPAIGQRPYGWNQEFFWHMVGTRMAAFCNFDFSTSQKGLIKKLSKKKLLGMV